VSPTQTNLLQGTLDLLILKSLALGEMHGLGISRRIEQVTQGTFQVKPGSLFPALHRMEEAGWLTAVWGERRLGTETEQWNKVALAMANALKAT
jgi:PadR family transcriptional regulator PadR